ncbi:MAG: hypothetical protein K6F47_06505 [Bacteroidaceae bacterium]|nr:hypothetical protein [Bacteroidaceae bacterium]
MDAETFSAKDGSNNDVVGRYDGRWKAHSCTYKFTMPAEDVTVSANKKANGFYTFNPATKEVEGPVIKVLGNPCYFYSFAD